MNKNTAAAITLLTACIPEVKDKTTVQLGDVTLHLEDSVLIDVEQMPDLEHGSDMTVTPIWGAPVFALKLKLQKNHSKMVFTLGGN